MTPPPGPRDWTPSPPPSAPVHHPATYRQPARPYSRVGTRRGAAWWSLLLGTAAIVFAVLQPGDGSTTSGFLVSTVGISGVLYGIFALRGVGEGGGTRAVATTGVTFGSVGTLVMAVYLVTFLAGSPRLASPLSFFVNDMPLRPVPVASAPALLQAPRAHAAATQAQVPAAEAPAEPVVSAPADGADERMQMVQSVGTLAYVMKQLVPDHGWPSSLAVTTDTGTVLLPDGRALGRIPLGTMLAYEAAGKGMGYVMTISGPLSGAVVEYSSATDRVVIRD